MNFNWQRILISLPGIIIGLTLHEYCHALAAYKLGDHTAREMGRLSFNPLKHIDLIGFLFIIFAGFGWAKPVRFNPENLRHRRRDKAIIAAAGPLSNLVLALASVAVVRGLLAFHRYAGFSFRFSYGSDFYFYFFFFLLQVLIYGAMINLGLFVFNLFPIPPLDGSHIVFSGLNISPETEYQIMKIGAPLLFIILIIQNRANVTILPIGKIVSAILELLLPNMNF
jgi:Zn-dependent protease